MVGAMVMLPVSKCNFSTYDKVEASYNPWNYNYPGYVIFTNLNLYSIC